ncbi:MAG: ribosome maturation factor RimM [Methylobacter sp.]|nr:ribosome maturation factor RimM [Methylobacter sp.]MDP2428980.1 ribosome maturation factor RimM [Methylobacter sp.]MDP3055264.1 ribosome maturation factor RimM [Methylobacter sp.]MDP3361292.1 ribosome maturation factor RimM [Methylobacter sp.]MDZ4219267.1 ribosome maturation factor RimM [Methylobacter sp.]
MTEQQISVGKISGVFGIKGWVKVFSFTDPRENILTYSPWLLKKGDESKILNVVDGQLQGKTIVAQLDGINDRDRAASLMGWDVFIRQDQLPKTGKNEYYWSELIGLKVETIDGIQLGVVDSLLETGANDVIIVQGERERVIPFLQGQTITTIDLNAGIIIVDWDPEF